MKTPSEPNDPLLQSLVEDANELAQAAAAEARSRRRAHLTLVRIGTPLVILLAAALWSIKHSSHHEAASQVSDVGRAANAPKFAMQRAYVRVNHPGEPAEDDSVPPDATEQEKQLLNELPDVPLLLVRNDAGQVTRVHVFESTR